MPAPPPSTYPPVPPTPRSPRYAKPDTPGQVLLLLLFSARRSDHLQKLLRASDHLLRPGLHDQVNQPSHVIHLPVVPENRVKSSSLYVFQNIRGLQPAPLVHPHVQLRVKPEGEPRPASSNSCDDTPNRPESRRLVVPAVPQEIPQIPEIMIHENKPTIIRHVSQRRNLIETDQATIPSIV